VALDLPAGESTYHSAPNWSRFWPFVSPQAAQTATTFRTPDQAK